MLCSVNIRESHVSQPVCTAPEHLNCHRAANDDVINYNCALLQLHNKLGKKTQRRELRLCFYVVHSLIIFCCFFSTSLSSDTSHLALCVIMCFLLVALVHISSPSRVHLVCVPFCQCHFVLSSVSNLFFIFAASFSPLILVFSLPDLSLFPLPVFVIKLPSELFASGFSCPYSRNNLFASCTLSSEGGRFVSMTNWPHSARGWGWWQTPKQTSISSHLTDYLR